MSGPDTVNLPYAILELWPSGVIPKKIGSYAWHKWGGCRRQDRTWTTEVEERNRLIRGATFQVQLGFVGVRRLFQNYQGEQRSSPHLEDIKRKVWASFNPVKLKRDFSSGHSQHRLRAWSTFFWASVATSGDVPVTHQRYNRMNSGTGGGPTNEAGVGNGTSAQPAIVALDIEGDIGSIGLQNLKRMGRESKWGDRFGWGKDSTWTRRLATKRERGNRGFNSLDYCSEIRLTASDIGFFEHRIRSLKNQKKMQSTSNEKSQTTRHATVIIATRREQGTQLVGDV
ncbi:hypothetical protein GALMADRAFT_214166 [Galerina marginata CBS 339.88]|uniref:Uncharacterized protein n=1 Tax=Galerina marginata (strain CBS 339.88) TaxID=685588 RepID=A0A067SL53_GALM3|nr:hypothetical protein GALMADRAFT_214166 [Galerina marginata CBS 339.88]